MHCLAVIRPLGTARQSIELEESATSGHLLQPGRVVFLLYHSIALSIVTLTTGDHPNFTVFSTQKGPDLSVRPLR